MARAARLQLNLAFGGDEPVPLDAQRMRINWANAAGLAYWRSTTQEELLSRPGQFQKLARLQSLGPDEARDVPVL